MLRDNPARPTTPDTSGVVLTCGDPGCGHTYEPAPAVMAAAAWACPRCDGETLTARVDEPAVERTAAQARADLFLVVAAHLRAHPQLTVPGITTPGDIHVSSRHDTGALVGWYRSLGVQDLQVDLFDGYAAVHAPRTPLGGGQITADVWGGVEGLQKLLVQGGGYTRLPFTLAELEHYAGHGTLPEAGGLR